LAKPTYVFSDQLVGLHKHGALEELMQFYAQNNAHFVPRYKVYSFLRYSSNLCG
jgi:hypothetical protein